MITPKNLFKQPFFWTSICSCLALGILVALYSHAWVAPTASPNSNAGAAINFSSGNVGIGTTAPGGKLQIVGNTGWDTSTRMNITNGATDYGRTNLILTGRFQADNDAWTFGSGARNSIVFAQNAAASGVNVGGVGTEQYSIQVEGNSNSLGFLSATNGATPNMVLLQNGNVGIGTTGPVAKLDTTLGSPSGHVPMLYGGWSLQFPRTIQNVSASITTNGNIVGTGPVIGLNLENSSQTNGTYSPLITFARQTASGGYNDDFALIGGIATGDGLNADWVAGDLTFGTAAPGSGQGPLERMRIMGNGNIGIGNAGPTHKLDVAGDLYITGNTNICTLVAYTGGSGTTYCPTGYYTWSAVGLTDGYMLCCKVSNPV
ncbi:MAG: hypothetical protein NTX26_00685 [Candidatus Parcubacteria bacterium]|nr:hypothetical protein [Candidatus Parcubacteria bacterium]